MPHQVDPGSLEIDEQRVDACRSQLEDRSLPRWNVRRDKAGLRVFSRATQVHLEARRLNKYAPPAIRNSMSTKTMHHTA
jgi:hypothetical protein